MVRFGGGRALSRGTGFIFAYPIQNGGYILSLVTNYHILTGAAPRRKLEPVGDAIGIELRTGGAAPEKVYQLSFPLKTTHGIRTWVPCPSFPDADIAAVPLPLNQAHFSEPPYCLDTETTKVDVDCFPGQAVAVIGYPLGWRDRRAKLPVWKTGHLASEPDLDFDGDPRLLIDITGRPGMSGSPVIAGHMSPYRATGGMLRFGGSGKLIGVYSSNAIRTPREGESAEELSIEEAEESGVTPGLLRPELGFVWKAHLVIETMASIDVERFRTEIWPKLGSIRADV